ncbi:hypothetical protein LWM68_42585 [Niabella sp. W65]|nr:hypothetical protein [Niabella sp. W65]MCH7368834.1 hypothetical protein [Niabella sp. W65]
MVYLYDSLQGIFVFDYYGAYKNRIDITRWSNLRIADQYITGVANGKFYRYHTATFKYDEWALPENLGEYRQVLFKEGKLYALGKEGLEIYKLNGL